MIRPRGERQHSRVGDVRVVQCRTDLLVLVQEVRAGVVRNISGHGFAEDEFGSQETDDAARPVQIDARLLGQLFQRDLPLRGDDAEEVEVEGHLDGRKLVSLAAESAEVPPRALDEVLEVFQGSFQPAVKPGILERLGAANGVRRK